MSKRDLLRCELGADSRLFAVHNLLNPKPKFELPGSELLGRLKAFIPELRVANAELADPQVLKEKQLEEPVAAEKVHIRSLFPERESRRAFRRTGTKSRKQYINMDLFMGVFDVQEASEGTREGSTAQKKRRVEEL